MGSGSCPRGRGSGPGPRRTVVDSVSMSDETSEGLAAPRRALAPRILRIAAWTLSVSAVVFLATLELGRSRTEGGSLSVADYEARAETVDTPAPDFDLPLVEGTGSMRLSGLRGEVVVLNFWASWCAPCRLEAPDLQAAWEDYQDRGVRFVGVDELDDRFAAQGFIREFGITYPSVFDPSGSLADDYAFIGLPATFVIDAHGMIRYRFQGYLNGEILRSSLGEVLDGASG